MNTNYGSIKKFHISALILLFFAVFFLSFAIGKYPITPYELVQILFGKILGLRQTWSLTAELVVFNIRTPRILAGAVVGASLSAAGASFQGLFKNPLVSPDVLGASSGAGFGAALSLYLGLSYGAVAAVAFCFGSSAVGLAYIISSRSRHNPVLGMVLSGIMISSLFSAATSFIKLAAESGYALPAITFWLMGSIANVSEKELMWALLPISAGLTALFLLRWQLNLLAMGEDEARSMGVNTKMLRLLVVASATLVTAACVSISGMIGWVGLVIPHFARMIIGCDYRNLLPSSMLLGAVFLMLVDIAARSVSTYEIPIGILTAFIGAPFFLFLILNRGNEL